MLKLIANQVVHSQNVCSLIHLEVEKQAMLRQSLGEVFPRTGAIEIEWLLEARGVFGKLFHHHALLREPVKLQVCVATPRVNVIVQIGLGKTPMFLSHVDME